MRSKSSSISKLSGEFYDLAIDTNKIVEAIGQDFNGKLPSLLIGNLRDLGAKQKLVYETLNKYAENVTKAADAYKATDEELAKAATLLGIDAMVGVGYGGEKKERYADMTDYKWRSWEVRDKNNGTYIRTDSDTFECTGYVRNRINTVKKRDTYIDIPGNGGDWWGNAQKKDPPMSVGQEVRADSIACFSGPGSAGHVVYVENVKDGMVYFTEANADGGIGDEKMSPSDGVLKCLSIKEFELMCKKDNNPTFQGYIYL
jgi:surface antigen